MGWCSSFCIWTTGDSGYHTNVAMIPFLCLRQNFFFFVFILTLISFTCTLNTCWKKQQNINVVGMRSPGKSQDVSQDLDMRKDTLIPGNKIVDLPVSLKVPLSNKMDAFVPLFTLKYGNVSLPIMCDKADCHVDDLIIAFQDESFVRNVIKYGDI